MSTKPIYASKTKQLLQKVGLVDYLFRNLVTWEQNPIKRPVTAADCDYWMGKNSSGLHIVVDYPTLGGSRAQTNFYITDSPPMILTRRLSPREQVAIAECLKLFEGH